MAQSMKILFSVIFLIFLSGTSFYEFALSAESNKNCIQSEEICGNGIDEDCSGSDQECKNCVESSIPTSGCNCAGKAQYTGFCCGNIWQSTPCGGVIHYIDTNGDDANNGSKLKPFKTLYNAVKKVKAGDTILINPGHYVEKNQISIRISGEKNRPIVIRGNGKGAFIDLSECGAGNCFEIHFANYIIIENLSIRASKNGHSRGIRLTHSKGSIIRSNKVYGAGHANIFCSLSDYTVFEKNEAFNGKIGIYASDSSDFVVIRQNTLFNNSGIGLHMNGDRGSGDGLMSKITVEGNIIFNNGTGINCDGVVDSVFQNNLIYNNYKRGIAFFQGDGALPSNNNYIINNTILMPKGAYYAIGLNTGAYQNSFFNNIILCGGKVPAFSTTGKAHELKIESDHNLFIKNGIVWEIEDSAYRLGKWERIIRTRINKISKYIKGNENDRYSIQANAEEIFVDSQKNDFRLKPTSPALDRGISKHSYGKDIEGNTRSKNGIPDIGAYEYNPKSNRNITTPQLTMPRVTKKHMTSQKKLAQVVDKPAPTKEKKFGNKLGMVFSYVSPGSFKMGIECHSKSDKTPPTCRQVNLTKGFYLQTTEVTQAQWKKIMNNNPSFFKQCGDNCPVEQVSWNDVQKFINQLNKIDNSSTYRLPTEAEWEYACRAGTETPFSFGECLSTEQANYCGQYPFTGCQKGIYREKPDQVNHFPKNAWGFSSMHGNVWEWCQDWLSEYPSGTLTDPPGAPKSSVRVIRGGGWNSYGKACASGNRSGASPEKFYANLGFRLVREDAATSN